MTNIEEKYIFTFGYGTWNVTTEGDCEGRSVLHLGVYTGYIDEIALALSKHVYYKLRFELFDDLTSNAEIAADVEISVPRHITDDQTELLSAMLKKRPVTITQGKYGVKIINGDSPEAIALAKKESDRASALAKLTDDEKAALGL